MTALWSSRYPDETADLEQHLPPVNLHSHHVLPYEWSDDKADGRPDMHAGTQPGDLDHRGRTLKPGR